MKIPVDIDINLQHEITFILRKDITFEYFEQKITIPKGFKSDGMSVPRILWGLIGPKIDGDTLLKSIGHDYLYQIHAGFFKSNYWFYKQLRNCLSWWKRLLILVGLDLFGWSHYYFK